MVSIFKYVYVVLLIICFTSASFSQDSGWTAPPEADSLKSPVPPTPATILEGKKIFASTCWTCHGKEGKGDGPAGKGLKPKPADLCSEELQKQSDGAIYWKITHGKGVMQPYKNTFSELQRWKLVHYIRSLKKISE